METTRSTGERSKPGLGVHEEGEGPAGSSTATAPCQPRSPAAGPRGHRLSFTHGETEAPRAGERAGGTASAPRRPFIRATIYWGSLRETRHRSITVVFTRSVPRHTP